MNRFHTLWTGLSARDRRILLLGAALALPLLGWALLWQPLSAVREAAEHAHAETAAQLAEAQRLAAQLASRGSSGRTVSAPVSPLAAVEAVSRELGLGEALKRREAEGANGLRLSLDNAPAEAVMRLLERLEQQHGLHVSQAQLDPAGPGRIHATLTLQRR